MVILRMPPPVGQAKIAMAWSAAPLCVSWIGTAVGDAASMRGDLVVRGAMGRGGNAPKLARMAASAASRRTSP